MELSGTLILAGLIMAMLWLLSMKNHKTHLLPPGPTGLPLIGNLLQVEKKTPFEYIVKLSERYGPVITLHLGLKRTVFLVGYDTVKEALVDQADDFAGRGPVPFLMKASKGYGMTFCSGKRWHQLRQFTLTTLKDFGMGRKRMEEWIQETSRHLVAHIGTIKATPFDPTHILSCCVSNVVCCLVFGQHFSYDDKDFLHLLNNFKTIAQFNSSPFCQLYNVFPWLMDRLPGKHHSMFALMEEVRDFIKMMIQEHQKTMDPSFPRDYIDCFLIRLNQEKDNPTTEFHYNNLVSSVWNLFLAGTETTSTTIRYALSVLIKYPNIQEKIQQEIDATIGREQCPSTEDKKSLPFTYAVIHEVQRFLDLVPFSLPHCAQKDILFRGYTIPKGTIIFPTLYSVLRDEKQWATPWSFNPQHFLDHSGNFKKNPAFMPFSAGRRSCLGQSLARTEIFIFLASMLQQFNFSCPGGPDSIDLSPLCSSFAKLPRTHQIIATPR